MVAISPKGDKCPQAVIAVINECLHDPNVQVRRAAERALGIDFFTPPDKGAGLGHAGAYTWGPVLGSFPDDSAKQPKEVAMGSNSSSSREAAHEQVSCRVKQSETQ